MNTNGHTHPRLTVAVAGATGFVGRHAVRTLLQRGHRVRALVRDPRKARSLPDPETETGLTLIQGDLFSDDTLDRLANGGIDAVLNCVGIRRETTNVSFEKAHPAATERTLELTRRGDAERYVLISAIGVGPDADTEYARSKHTAETLVRRSGLGWTILRPSIIHGPDGEMAQMLKDWALGREAPYVFMPYFTRVEIDTSFPPAIPPKPPRFPSAVIAPVSVDDVAAAVAEALVREDAVGEVYPLAGPDNFTWPEFLRFARDNIPMAERNRPILGLPGVLGQAMAIAAKPLGLAALLPFGASEPILATHDNTADTHKARQHLGFDPAPFKETFAAYAEQI